MHIRMLLFSLAEAPHIIQIIPYCPHCIFLGYSSLHKGYRCFNPSNQQVIISRHVKFNELTQPSLPSPATYTPTSSPTPLLLTPSYYNNTHSSNSSSPPIPNTDSAPPSETSISPSLPLQPPPLQLSKPTVHPMQTRSRTVNLKPKHIFSLQHSITSPTNLSPDPSDPTCFYTAVKLPHWRKAMSEEFLALQRQATWDLVPPPTNKTILGCRWTFHTKRAPDGTMLRYKTRLVAQGFKQSYGVDYTDTFNPVAKLPIIRVLLTAALHYRWVIHQLDVVNAFMHGLLDEDVYMFQPAGFIDEQHPNHVCHLNKAFYGLKQAPQQWHITLSAFLLSNGFKVSDVDQSLYISVHQGTHTYFLIYVDDILLTGNCHDTILSLITKLHQQFTLKDLGRTNSYLSIQITETANKYFLT